MHGANGRVFCISKFAMIQNDFVMLTRRLIRSNTAWLYSFLFHIHRIASASTAFDFLTGKFVPKNHPKQTKTSCLAMTLRSWVLLPMWDFKALKHSWPRAISNTWVSMGHEPLPKFCPQKNRPGKFTWVKVTIGGRSSYVVRSPGRELECFFYSEIGGSWQSLRIREFEGRWNMFILPKKFAPENVRAWFSMFSPLMQVTLDVIFNILCGIWDTLMIWTNPIAR